MPCDDAKPRVSSDPGRRAAPSSCPVLLRVAGAATAALFAANCSAPPKLASNGRTLDPKYGVYASPRVVADGQPVPKGGGREMVGKPYQVAGRTYVPQDNPRYSRTGLASWYGADFHGRLTANGEIFDRESLAAAHATMPLPSYARVTNLENRRSMIVRVNDRGPYHANRVMDVSERVAEALEFRRAGTARVKVDYIGRASTRGSDDTKLMATLRTNGSPAAYPGRTAPVMLAGLEPSSRRTPSRVADEDAGPVPVRRAVAVAVAAASEPETDEEAETTSAEVPAARPAAPRTQLASLEGRPASAGRRPPPERPLDLGTIPDAASPIAAAPISRLPPPRPVMAGMFFAPTDPPSRFKADDPFASLRPQRFVALKAHSQRARPER